MGVHSLFKQYEITDALRNLNGTGNWFWRPDNRWRSEKYLKGLKIL